VTPDHTLRSAQADIRRTARFYEDEAPGLRFRLLEVVEREVKPTVTLDHRRISLTVRPGSTTARRAEVMHD